MDDELKQNLTAAETWIRGLFILLFVFFLVVARVVTGAVVVIQFLFTVFSGQSNENLRSFGASLAQFIFQALMFMTYNSDDKPFPFSPWPDAETAGPKAVSSDIEAEDWAAPEVTGDESQDTDAAASREPGRV